MALKPLHDLVHEGSSGGWCRYQATGNDPRLAVGAESDLSALRPGWYLMSLPLRPIEGELFLPCLYPDFGLGQSEATRIDLPLPGADGTMRALVLIKGPLKALRLDPTVRPGRFEIGVPSLKRISRLRAFAHMVLGVAQAESWDRTVLPRTLAEFIGGVVRNGLSAATARLAVRYSEAIRDVDRGYPRWVSLFSGKIAPVDHVHSDVESEHGGTPLFSVLVPVHETPPQLLRNCLDSVLRQSERRWELCVVDDASTSPAVRELLEEYAGRDARIRLHRRSANGHICRATNDALQMARAPYVAFLDHDDELAPDALAQARRAFADHPSALIVYSDEDKMDENGRRFDPHFKPAWSPDLLRSYNYICHLTVIATHLVRAVGGLRPGFEGAQDHDLILRCTERVEDEQIVHIPSILYHWRAIQGSTALGWAQKPYALEAGRRAVAEHLERMGMGASVSVEPGGHYRIVSAATSPLPSVCVVIPTRDRIELLRPCIESIRAKTDYPFYRVLVLDNGSSDPETLAYLDSLAGDDRIDVQRHPGPFNYSAIINAGVRQSSAEVICLLNNDVEVISPGWLAELVGHAARADVGAVGGMLYYPDDTIQHAGVILGLGGVAGHVHGRLPRGSQGYMSRAAIVQNVTAVTGACMAFRRDVFDQVGGFDESLRVAFNDIDFCIRVRAEGFTNVWTPLAELYHHESASRGSEDTPEKRARFAREVNRMIEKWGDQLLHDPAYNPNLALDGPPFDLAFPPRRVRSRTARFALAS